jgi:3-oxoadipate enol-lactonase
MTVHHIDDHLARLRQRAEGRYGPPLPPGRSVDLPGRGTTFVHEGRGPSGAPTLMLLHGLGATASLNWFTSFPTLEDRYHVVALDHRGHGRGIRTRAPFTLEDAADDVVALADELHIGRFVAVGYSMGGPIAQLLWRRHRDRISGLVMCATAHRFRATPREHVMFAALPGLEQVNRILPEAFGRRLIAQISRSFLDEPGLADWAQRQLQLRDPRAVLQAAVELGRYSAGDWIAEIDVPTAVLVHTRDHVVPPRRQLELASAVRNAVTHLVPADHLAVVRSRKTFVSALTGAVEDVTSSDPAAVLPQAS